MSELQIGLIVSAMVIVVLVFIFGELYIWHERKKIYKNFAHDHLDVLLDVPKNHVRDAEKNERLEPSFVENTNPTEQNIKESENSTPDKFQQTEADPEPTNEQQTENKLISNPPIAEQEPAFRISIAELALIELPWFNPKLDFVADIALRTTININTLPRFSGSRHIKMAGCLTNGRWQLVEPIANLSYIAFRIGLQCVDRNGAVSEEELTNFYRSSVQFAKDINAEISLPPRQKQLDRAQKLDAFCAEVDVLVGIHLLFEYAVNAQIVSDILLASGFTLEPDGVFHYLNDDACSLYNISSFDRQPFEAHLLRQMQINALTLSFDIPRVSGGIDTFDEALVFAKELTTKIGARLVDDNQRELSETGLGHIRQQILQIYQRMQEQEIEPGGELAMRLFS